MLMGQPQKSWTKRLHVNIVAIVSSYEQAQPDQAGSRHRVTFAYGTCSNMEMITDGIK